MTKPKTIGSLDYINLQAELEDHFRKNIDIIVNGKVLPAFQDKILNKPYMFKHDDLSNLKNIIWAIEKIEKSLGSLSSVIQLEENEEKYDSVIVKLMNRGIRFKLK